MTDTSTLSAALPDYEIGAELGRGRFGVVYAGRHRRLEREVAIREVPPELADDPDVRRRFAAEARRLVSLSHPHIVRTFDYVARKGHCLLVMERVSGGTVWSEGKDRGVTPETACALVLATCAGLHHAHERGVLHRDLKPESLLLTADRVLKITDFGLAEIVGGDETVATKNGGIFGTPAFMAPEQAGGAKPAVTADVYATGVVLYELLSGRLPFSDDGGALAIVERHLYEDPVDLGDAAPEVPDPIADVTMQSIERFPDDRFPTAEAFGVALGVAAAAAWGPDWRARAELAIVEGGPITDAARRPDEGTPPEESAGSRRRLAAVGHAPGVAPAALLPGELVPVRELLRASSSPLAAALAALVLLVVTVSVAFVGLGRSTPEVTLPPGAIMVAGTDVADGEVVELDLAKPVEVGIGVLPPEAADADAVQLEFWVGGVPLPASGVGTYGGTDGVKTTTVEATSARFLAAGELTGAVSLLVAGEEVARSEFRAAPKGSPFLTLPGVVTVMVLLVVLAFAAVLLRPGRRPPVGVASVAAVGAALGAVLVPLGWMMGAPEPQAPTFLVCAVFGSAAGIAAAVAAGQAGMRRLMAPRAPEPCEVAAA